MKSFVSLLVVVLVVAGCAPSPGEFGGAGVAPTAAISLGVDDPLPPENPSVSREIGSDGGNVANEFVSVKVPPDAWGTDATATVELGIPLGTTSGPFAVEVWGAPVNVEHSSALVKPLEVTWDVSGLDPGLADSLMLVHWDEELEVWRVAEEEIVVENGLATASVTGFSWVDWLVNSGVSGAVASFGQVAGEWTGKRSDAPECSSAALPSWVKQVVRPDEDLSATAIRTCVEAGTDGLVTVRIANNRSHSQMLTLEPEGEQWASVEVDSLDFSPTGTLWSLTRMVLDTDSSSFIPPTTIESYGVRRPSTPGQTVVVMSAAADPMTLIADLLGMAVDNLSVGGFDSPILNAFAQGLYKCGGQSLLKSWPDSAAAIAAWALSTTQSCVEAMTGSGSDEFAEAIERDLRTQIAEGGEAAGSAIKQWRLVNEISDWLQVVKVAEWTEYVGNQVGDSLVGPVTVSLRLLGEAPVLGDWTASCTDADADSGSLYQNLTLQKQFSDTSKEFWEFDGWAAASLEAIQPLAGCSSGYLEEVAANIDSTWGDKSAAAIVSADVRALAENAPDGATTTGTSIIGTWSGTVTQSGSGTYSVTVTLDGEADSIIGEADYPELGCGGTWALASHESDTYEFTETITYGSGCVQQVDIHIRALPSGELSYQIDPPYTSTATLSRVQVPAGADSSADTGWPVDANDASPALMAWFGAAAATGNSSVGFPNWVSCTEGIDICIAGGDAMVGVIERGTSGFHETHTIPISRPAQQSLLGLGLSQSLVTELLTDQ